MRVTATAWPLEFLSALWRRVISGRCRARSTKTVASTRLGFRVRYKLRLTRGSPEKTRACSWSPSARSGTKMVLENEEQGP